MKIVFSFLACLWVLACSAQDVVKGNNQFSFDFYQTVLAKERNNAFASPFSVSSAFAMLYAGAENETMQEISKALHFGSSSDFHTQQAKMQNDLQANLPVGMSLDVANALWLHKDATLLPAYSRIIEEQYKGKVALVNFGDATGTCKAINDWASLKTRDKIKEILAPQHINELTRLILTNAIYFKASWQKAFDKKDNQKMPFTTEAGIAQEHEFMHAKDYLNYYENEQMQMLEIPYTNKSASMLVFLPREGTKLEAFEKDITFQNYETWTQGMKNHHEVHVYLPKFKIESSFGLNEPLQKMGIKKAFTQGADFKKIMKDIPLFVSQVLHKSFVEVNEEGTEAAAVTAIIMQTTSSIGSERPSPKIFKANRPFVFAIKDNKTGAILFIGKVMKP
jgi:serpin B